MKNMIYKPFTLQDADRREPHAAAVIYRPSDPFAVELVMPRVNHDAVSVLFGRALLLDGLEDAAGDGVVRIAPHDADGWISLTVPVDGQQVEFYASRKALEGFVNTTFRLVRLGREVEHMDMDGLIARLLEVSA